MASTRPLVIAHRGFSAVAPENTLLAFERALLSGADLVELDYHHTADGKLAVIHDPNLDRTTDATNRWPGKNLLVSEKKMEELSGLEAGLWFKPPQPGLKVPTLQEALQKIQKSGMTLIERKAGDAATLVRLLESSNWINQVVVQSFDWDYLREFHQINRRQVLGALGPPPQKDGRKLTDPEKMLNSAWLDQLKPTGAQVVVWSKQINREAIAEAHRRGLKVWVYTINELALAQSLLAMGVDGIITDNPPIIWKALATKP